MAADDGIRAMEIYWTRDDSDISGDEVVTVPGVKAPGNKRPVKKHIQGRKTKEIKAAIPVRQPRVENLKSIEQTRSETQFSALDGPSKPDKLKGKEKNGYHESKVSLKDLRPEDKKRVANLITELARAGEERESARQQLEEERAQFDQEMTKLLNQQEQVLRDREGVQQQLFECQRLLALYQQQVLEAQQKIARSAAKLAQASGSPKNRRGENQRDANQSDLPFHHNDEQDLDTEKFDAFPRQNTNFQPDALQQPHVELYEDVQEDREPDEFHFRPVPTFYTQTSHDDPIHQEQPRVEQGAPGPSQEQDKWEITPGGTRRLRVRPPSSPSDRPFTNRIDRLIEAEMLSPGRTEGQPKESEHGRVSKKSGKALNSGQKFPPRDKYFGIGPLNPPVLSSTIKSDATSNCGSYVPHNAQEIFKPLLPDPDSVSTQSNPSETGNIHSKYQSGKVGFHQQLETHLPHIGMAEIDPRHDLLAQKEALLEEQRRLKAVLEQQEKLLLDRQEDLHHQQEQHRERLAHFQYTGQFPGQNNVEEREQPQQFDHKQLDPKVAMMPYSDLHVQHDLPIPSGSQPALFPQRKPIEPYPCAPVPALQPYIPNLHNPDNFHHQELLSCPQELRPSTIEDQPPGDEVDEVLGMLDKLRPRHMDARGQGFNDALKEKHMTAKKPRELQRNSNRAAPQIKHSSHAYKGDNLENQGPSKHRSPRKKTPSKNVVSPVRVKTAGSKKGRELQALRGGSNLSPALTGHQAAQLLKHP